MGRSRFCYYLLRAASRSLYSFSISLASTVVQLAKSDKIRASCACPPEPIPPHLVKLRLGIGAHFVKRSRLRDMASALRRPSL